MYVKCPMPDRGLSRNSTLGHLERWNAELLEKNKALEDKLRAANVLLIAHKEGERTLKECESIIESGMSAHVEAWFALKEIHDRKLYSPKYETFKDYCMERWGYVREGYRYLEAANVCAVLQSHDNVVTSLGANVPLPPSSAHARALAPLLDEPEKLKESWALALEINDGHPSFLEVKDIVAGFLPKPEIQEGESGRESGSQAVPSALDKPDSVEGTPSPPSREAAANTVSPHLSVHLSLDAAIEDAFKKAEAGDDQIIEDLKWAAYTISRKLKALGYEPFDWTKEEPT